MKTIRIGQRLVGNGQPCFVVAEIGSNHNGDFDCARRLIDAAAQAGCDAVKVQTFAADQHYSRRAPGFSYLDNVSTHGLIKSLEIDRSWHGPLKQHAEAQGMEFFSSPCDTDAIQDLHRLEVCANKVASFDLPDTFLIGEMAATGKPVILSTGMANYGDIQNAVNACRAKGNDDVILLQCTSLYPAPAHLSNLRSMATLEAAFGTLVGYSDHTEGDHVPLAAAAMGACMLEKHFTLDRSLPGPDHRFAIQPDEMGELVRKLRDIEAAMGDGIKNGPRAEEAEMFQKGRRSLHARLDIPAGTVITQAMLCVKRPGLGVPPHLSDLVVGRVARRDILADEWIEWSAV